MRKITVTFTMSDSRFADLLLYAKEKNIRFGGVTITIIFERDDLDNVPATKRSWFAQTIKALGGIA